MTFAAVSWLTIDGEFVRTSLAQHDTTEEAREVTGQINRRLGPGSNYRWYWSEVTPKAEGAA